MSQHDGLPSMSSPQIPVHPHVAYPPSIPPELLFGSSSSATPFRAAAPPAPHSGEAGIGVQDLAALPDLEAQLTGVTEDPQLVAYTLRFLALQQQEQL